VPQLIQEESKVHRDISANQQCQVVWWNHVLSGHLSGKHARSSSLNTGDFLLFMLQFKIFFLCLWKWHVLFNIDFFGFLIPEGILDSLESWLHGVRNSRHIRQALGWQHHHGPSFNTLDRWPKLSNMHIPKCLAYETVHGIWYIRLNTVLLVDYIQPFIKCYSFKS
jgi:hypothetical protein